MLVYEDKVFFFFFVVGEGEEFMKPCLLFCLPQYMEQKRKESQ